MTLDCGKALWADNVLDAAGIGSSGLRINAQADQPG